MCRFRKRKVSVVIDCALYLIAWQARTSRKPGPNAQNDGTGNHQAEYEDHVGKEHMIATRATVIDQNRVVL